MKEMRLEKVIGIGLLIALLLMTLAACGQNGGQVESPTVDEPEAAATVETEAPEDAPASEDPASENEASEPVRIESGGEVPFYARFGENETFGDDGWVAIVFYRPPDCIPVDFNLNEFFHFPGGTGPGAFGCGPPTTNSTEFWRNGPETDPAPLVAEVTGRGAVPVWFFAEPEIETAMADGVVTIEELAALPSLRMGTASTYTELLHPSQSNAESLIRFTAEGAMEEGGRFSVEVSYGVPDVANHTTIVFED